MSNIPMKKKLPIFTVKELAEFSVLNRCCVSLFGHIIDLSQLIAEGHGALADPLIARSGQDVSDWFVMKGDKIELRTYIHPVTSIEVPYLPNGRFIHVPPSTPTTSWEPPKSGTVWWQDESLVIGLLSKKSRTIKIINTLTSQEHVIECGTEQTLADIARKYLPYNYHAGSYVWKSLIDGEFKPLNMELTLEENGLEDDSEELETLGLDPENETFLTTILLFFQDDLTVA